MSNTDPRPSLAAVGDNCVDVLHPAERRFIGGNALNVAVQFARLEGRSSYFGAVGQDDDGALTKGALERNGVDVRHLVRRQLPTARTEIEVAANGERRIFLEDFGACAGYAPDEAAVSAILSCDHVHIGWLDDGGALRRRLTAAGKSVSQDIAVNSSPENLGVEDLSIVFASMDGAHALAALLARSLFSEGARGVVVMRGARGSSVFMNGAEADIPALRTTPVDTTGAGDSYIAAFLHALLSGASPEVAGKRATAHAATTCMHEGGFPQEAGG